MSSQLALLAATTLLPLSWAQVSKYQPCPLLGPYFPPPRIDSSSPVLHSAFEDFTALLDQYIDTGNGRFGPISPNTTSFSLALFAGSTYVPREGDDTPFFYEYHHTAQTIGDTTLEAHSKLAIGDLTQIFTALTVLLEFGDRAWPKSIVEFVPELRSLSHHTDPIEHVQWRDVTLGALASHMAGIARDSHACQIDDACANDEFLQHLTAMPPVELPDSTPIFSHAAFQLLAVAIEAESGKPFSEVLTELVLQPLSVNSTRMLATNPSIFGNGLRNTSMSGEPASLGLVSSITDLSIIGRSLLTSNLLGAAETRRWLKPFSSTSNLRNAVGRPWEIYHYSDEAIDPIIDVYTKTGTVGRYSSYFGLAPSVDVGFAILAVDSEGEAPDLNAYADLALAALVQIQELGYKEANETIAGRYRGPNNGSLTLKLTGSDPAMSVTTLFSNGTDWLNVIAGKVGIDRAEHLDLRLYPTGLEKDLPAGGKSQVFQGVMQDKRALVDAGTPTCISWQTVGEIRVNGAAADRFVLTFGKDDTVEEIAWKAGGVAFAR